MFEIIDKTWKVKIVSPDYVLSVSRREIKDDTGTATAIDLTMKPFVEGMAEAFKDIMPGGAINTPWPEKVRLDKDEASEQENKEVLRAGYQRAVGMALWAVRHVYVECKFGISQACSVMAKPSWKAFKAVMHLIQWMAQQPQRGIRFTASGNQIPYGQFDASNKPHPETGLSQAGYIVHWMGGPVMTYTATIM